MTRILVPVDFSRASLEALDDALELAESVGARVDVLHVVETIEFVPLVGPPTTLDAARRDVRHAARQRLERLRRKLGDRRCEIGVTLEVGAPHRLIVHSARKLAVDLIVIATHGRSGLSRLLLGSVAEKVVRTADCPVLTIRPRPKPRRRRSQGRRR